MRPTKVLPESYVRHEAAKPEALNRVGRPLGVACVIFFTAALVLFNGLARVLRPGFTGRVSSSNLAFDPLYGVAALVALPALFAAHELIHAAVVWLLTRERPCLRVSSWAFQVQAPGWYLPRNALLVALLAPVCLLSLVGAVLLLLVPLKLVSLMVVLLTANLGGSAFDLAEAFYVWLLPASTYLCGSGTTYADGSLPASQGRACIATGAPDVPDIYIEKSLHDAQAREGRLEWRARLRSFLEGVVSRLA